MKYLRQVIASAKHDKIVFTIGIVNGLGLLLVVGVGLVYDLSVTGWILGWLLVSGVTELLLAWNNERRLAAGQDRAWHELVGQPVVACRRFERHAGEYKGLVRLGPERWKAVSRAPLAEGERAVVAGRRGLVLEVEPRPEAPGASAR